jgi:hypothetical protein
MIKIDKLELFRVFVVLEASLVGIPVVVFLSAAAALYLFGHFAIATFWAVVIFLVGSLYILLPALVAPGLFQVKVLGVLPESIAGWLVVVGVYSVIALLLALPVSIRTPSRRRRRLSAECVAAAGRGKAPGADEAKVGDKTDGAT